MFNGSAECEGGRGDSSVLWDEALELGIRLHSIATDDSHMPLFDIGLAWTWVNVAQRTPEAAVSALRDGHSYGSTGPRVFDLCHDQNKIEIRCSPVHSIHVTTSRQNGSSVVAGRGGRLSGRILETDGAGLLTHAVVEYDPTNVSYVRVRIVDAGGHQAWTNVL